MSRYGQFALLLVLPVLSLAQVTANTVTVTASQSAAAQPDTAIFSVTVMSGIDKNLSDILQALQGSGISAANFVNLYSDMVPVGPQPVPASQPAVTLQVQLGWDFQLTVPLAKVKDTTAALTALAQNIPQNNGGLSVTFQLFQTQASSQQTANCNLADLVASARTQAQQLTSAAGLVPGMIQSISTSVGPNASCFLTVRFLLGTQLMLVEPSSISVVASRARALQPDQVLISLSVSSGLNTGLDDITAALQQAGISGAAFIGVNTQTVFTPGTGSQPRLQWTFRLTAPLSDTKDTLAAIVAAQQALAKASADASLSFFVSGTQVSPQLAAAQTCPQTDLVKDAQARAQAVAAAAGVSAGTILDLNEGNAAPAFASIFDPFAFVSVSGIATFQLGVISNVAPGLASTCSLSVTFRLQQ
jgi:uncharacterized protein YggE